MRRSNLFDIFKVIFSNFVLIFAGVVTSFVLPKYFSLDDFGYYKIFNLYTTYIIVLQFGISEGLYLRYGGKTLNDIDKNEFSGVLKCAFFVNAVISFVLLVVSCILLEDEYRFIFAMLALDVIIVNITNVFQFLSQAVEHFTELSIRNIVKSILIVIAVFAIVFINIKYPNIYGGYRFYVIALVMINAILMFWYLYTYKSVYSLKAQINFSETLKLIKLGFPLCLSNIISSLILSMDRQIVSIYFGTSDYAIYAFAYSLLTLVSTVITAIAAVVFPMFKKKTKKVLKTEYVTNLSTINMAVSLMSIIYFPLCWFIKLYLPTYNESLEIFRIIIPGLMISSPISIVIHNYYKVLDKNFQFFTRSVIALTISVVANIIAYHIFGTMRSISYASIVVMIIWYAIEERRLKKEFIFNSVNSVVYMLIMCVMFYIITLIPSWIIGGLVYLLVYMVVTYIFHSQLIGGIIKKVFVRLNNNVRKI